MLTYKPEKSLGGTGRAPGNPVEGLVLRNVSLTIDRWKGWNYSHPDHDYRPTTCVPLDLEPWPTDGLFAESVRGLVLNDVEINFAMERKQSYWTLQCLNVSASEPVTQTGQLVCNNVSTRQL